MPKTRSGSFEVTVRCRICSGEHTVRGTAEFLRQPIVFGGGPNSKAAATVATWTAPITCPRQQRSFEGELLIPSEYNESVQRVQISSVADASGTSTASAQPTADAGSAPSTSAGDWIDEELKDWRKTTVPTLRSFATTMLTTSSGAVAVYFAVLKYLGWEKAHFGTALVALTITPPVLLFGAAATFALALRPSLAVVERIDYAEFRAQRIAEMYRRVTIGIVLYASALLLALVSFALALQASS